MLSNLYQLPSYLFQMDQVTANRNKFVLNPRNKMGKKYTAIVST